MNPFVVLVASLLGATPPYVRAHTTKEASSHCLWWPTPTITWQQNGAGNSATGPSAFDAVTASFATWQMAMEQCGSVKLVEGPRSSARLVGYNPDLPNNNVVLFRMSSCSKKVPATDGCWQLGTCGNKHDCWDHSSALLGITTVSYDTVTGRVYDADIELNSANNVYTTVNEPVCTGPLSQSCVATDVGNTMTHEIGHFLGLGHALAPESTMSAVASIGDTNKRVLDVGTKSFVCEVYTKDLAPKDCVIDATSNALGPPADVKTGCSSASAGPAFLSLLAAVGLLRRRRGRAVVALLVALLAPSAQATTVVALDVPRLTDASDAVVHAKVDRVESRWTGDHLRIVTDVHLVVVEPLKGAADADVIITQAGGIVGRVGQLVEGMASFEAGEEVVVFLEARGPHFAVTGLSQGKFHVDRPERNDAPVARQLKSNLCLVDPVTAEPVSPRLLALPLDTLRAQVKAAMMAGQPHESSPQPR